MFRREALIFLEIKKDNLRRSSIFYGSWSNLVFIHALSGPLNNIYQLILRVLTRILNLKLVVLHFYTF
jgi:hypothetical protein